MNKPNKTMKRQRNFQILLPTKYVLELELIYNFFCQNLRAKINGSQQ